MNSTLTNAKCSARILALRAAGKSLPEAIDSVLGAGTYAALVSDVYGTLRAKAAR